MACYGCVNPNNACPECKPRLEALLEPRGIKPFWGVVFKDGSVPDGQYARGWTKEEALAHAIERWGDKVDPSSIEKWDGVL